jgi:beta-glucosidase
MFKLNHPLETVGTGHCDYQAKPLPNKNEDGTFDIRSDWDKATIDSINAKKGQKRPIQGDLNELPNFDETYKTQMDRCADELHNNAFRMSLDFGRLCPKPEQFDEKLMGEYIKKIAYCRKKGMDPVVTLHHWPMPLAFAELDKNGGYKKGAWEHPEILKHFQFYIQKVAEYLFNPQKIRQILEQDPDFTSQEIDDILNDGSLVRTFLTINEPMCHFLLPYWAGEFPPFKKGQFKTGRKVLEKVGEAHHIAYQEMHNAADRVPDIQNDVRLGVAYNFIYFEGSGYITNKIADYADRKMNWDPIHTVEKDGKESEFFGIQYYHRQDVSLAEVRRKITGKDPRKDREYGDHPGFGDIHPLGMKKVIQSVSKAYPDKTLKVTEFGFADKKDLRKPYWIMETVKYILEAKAEGAKVDGIMLWSIINNMEWSAGMGVEFGIYDMHGNPLQTDDGNQISSRCVWATLSKYLNNPSSENHAKVIALYEMAKRQHESTLVA